MRNLFFFIFVFTIQPSLWAQIPVAAEPLHHILYEDEEIRVLEIVALPGDTALLHQHDYSYCYIATQGGKMWLQDLGEESRTVNLPTHYAGGKFELANGPFAHRFANIDSVTIRFFTVEHKSGIASLSAERPLPSDNILKSELFTVRKMNLAPLSAMEVPHNGTAIILNLTEIPVFSSKNQPIEYWTRFSRNEPIYVQNLAQDSILCAVFEIY